MYQNVDYSHLTGKDKIDAAVKDVKDFLTDKQWECVQEMLNDPCYSYEFFAGCLENLTGISGYPIQALWESAGHQLPAVQ